MNTATLECNELPPPPLMRYVPLLSKQEGWLVYRAVHGASQVPISCHTWATLMSQHPTLCYEFIILLRDLNVPSMMLECRGDAAAGPFEFAVGRATPLEQVQQADPQPFSQYLFENMNHATNVGGFGSSWRDDDSDEDEMSITVNENDSDDDCHDSSDDDSDAASDMAVGCVFDNLGRDATLVAPRPPSISLARELRFAHLANYIQQTPLAEAADFINLVAKEYKHMLANSTHRSVYLSTSGLGVSYLHFRLEHAPKYYNYEAFKKPPAKSGTDSSTSLLRVQIASDLHIEFYGTAATQVPKHLIVPNAPILALLGDIGLAFTDSLREFLHYQADQFEKVLFVLGNHEFYNVGRSKHSVSEQMGWLKKVCEERDNIHLLEKDSMDLYGIRILGTSLWSDIPDDMLGDAEMAMNDYAKTYNHAKGEEPRNLTASETCEWYQRNVQWLCGELAKAKREGVPTLVLTHHTPQLNGTSHPIYAGNPLACCFSSDLTKLLSFPIKAWACGHTHYNFDFYVGGSRLVSNQRGYKGEPNGDYRRDGLVLELQPVL